MSTTLEDIEDMPPVESMMAAKYMTANDLMGEQETVTIRKIQRGKETFDAGRKDEVNVIGVERAGGLMADMIWNKTNVACARVLLGDDNAKWIGKRVVLCADEDKMRGEMVIALRICGSPDSPPGRAKSFQSAWDHPDGRANGRKGKSSLVSRLKLVIARLKVKSKSAPKTDAPKLTPEEQAVLDRVNQPIMGEPPPSDTNGSVS